MPVSPTKQALERIRQDAAQDGSYLKGAELLFFWELAVPESLAFPLSNRFIFPMVLSPESYTMDEPFTVEKVFTQGGGIYVEENGIVARTIKIEGTFGFKPKSLRKRQPASLGILKPEKKSFTRELPAWVFVDISGMRHFQYLQDAVFRTYADLKRDPATSEETFLYFHNQKDDEHWLVVPEKFTTSRSADKRTLYKYSIEMTAIEKHDAIEVDFSEDKPLFDQLKDAIRAVKSAIDAIAGAINDIIAFVGEIVSLVKSVISIIDAVASVIDAARAFVNGVKALIELPFAVVDAIAGVVDSAMAVVEAAQELGEAVVNFPDNIKQKFRQITDGLEVLGTHPEVFETPAQRKMRDIKSRQQLSTSVSEETRVAALNTPAPTTIEENKAVGTGITQGDAISAQSEVAAGKTAIDYTSTRPVTVSQGDTLTNLAAKFLGDARLWQHIAVANNLKPPFIIETANQPLVSDDPAQPGVLNIGDEILIPTFSKPPQKQTVLPVLGVRPEEPAENHLLGTDVEIQQVAGRTGAPVYDLVIDTNRGSQDIKITSGVPNLGQAAITRLRTERGTNILYKKMGLQRIIGLNNSLVDLETARFRYVEALNQDPRIASVRRLDFGAEDDRLIVDADVEIKGFVANNNIKAVL
jgi:LysM repeat protein